MFAGIESALVQHLKDNLDGVTVLTAAELASVTEDRQPVPAVHVVYQGYQPKEVRNDGKAARIDQQWLIVIATKDVRSMRSGEKSRADASAIADKLLPLLMGWRTEAATGPFVLAPAPRPAYSHGITYMPLAFSVETALRVTS